MRIRWRRTTRSFLTASLAVIAVLIVALGLLGWQLLVQDRELERRRVEERLNSAADLAVDSLQRRFAQTETYLGALDVTGDPKRADVLKDFDIQDDALVAVGRADNLWSSVALPFYPDSYVPDPIDAVSGTFSETEEVELREHNLPAALVSFQRLTSATNAQVRAGAWHRVARVARALDRPRIALEAYSELSRMGSVPAAGRPADLVASFERCAYLEDRGEIAQLQEAAAAFQEELKAARWRLSWSAYRFYLSQAREWLKPSDSSVTETSAETLADGLAAAWTDGSGVANGSVTTGRRLITTEHGSTVIVWRRAAGQVVAIIALPGYVRREWLGDLPAIEARQRARITLTGEAGQPVLGAADTSFTIRRLLEETNLPFTVRLSTSDPVADAAMFSGRRSLEGSVIATLVLLLMAGGYVVARGVNTELETARLQSAFVSAVSHEFRTPVASLRQLSELLDEGRVVDDGRRSEYYRLLRRESERLQRLVEGLLDFGRMESSVKEYEFGPVDAGSLVGNVTTEFAETAGHKRQAITVAIDPALPAIHADREALGLAIWNLLDNAAKYSPSGSCIRVVATVSHESVAIRVRDEGPGIPASEQAAIFEKFVRGAGARASGAKGTGLGLAIVAHIVRAHGGEVRVDSESGKGSQFSILLPVPDKV